MPTQPEPVPLAYPPQVSSKELVLRRLLRVPPGPPRANEDQAHRLFSLSIVLSAARCSLSYVILPVIAPLIGSAAGGSPAFGIPLGVVALVFDIRAVRKFWLAEHRWRRPITALYAVIMAMVVGLLLHDILSLT